MNTKEYFIFLIIFTICYILFFLVYDSLNKRIFKQKLYINSLARINIEEYHIFSSFYGINESIVSIETIKNIYNYILSNDPKNIVEVANCFNINSYEFVIIYLYLEYISLLKIKVFDLTKGLIVVPSKTEEILVNKYYYYLKSKNTYQDIIKMFGNTIKNDLEYLNNKYLIPGVRFINSTLYYVGGSNEKK